MTLAQSNKLDYSILNMAFKGFYQLNDHAITFGYEREELDVFNLFIQHTETEIDFDRNPADTVDPERHYATQRSSTSSSASRTM